MNKTIRLIKSFAGYPVWEYILDTDENVYCWVVDKSNYKIHKDIVEWMPSYFEEVKESRTYPSEGEGYFFIKDTWYPEARARDWWTWHCTYWNYYKTKEWAQAVSDLRKHVYKFPMCRKDESNYAYYFDLECWAGLNSEDSVNAYYPDFIHRSSTEEDRAERLRLINECIKHNWYLTI